MKPFLHLTEKLFLFSSRVLVQRLSRISSARLHLQVSVDHVYEQAVCPLPAEQVPHHAPEVAGGAQQVVLAVLVDVLVGAVMNLHTRVCVTAQLQPGDSFPLHLSQLLILFISLR